MAGHSHRTCQDQPHLQTAISTSLFPNTNPIIIHFHQYSLFPAAMSDTFNVLVAPAPVALTNNDARRSSFDSSLVKIGLYLARTFTNTIAKRQKKLSKKLPSTSNSITPPPRHLTPPNLLATTPLVTLTPPPDIASAVAPSSPRNDQSKAIPVTQSQSSSSPRRRRKGRSLQSNDNAIIRSPVKKVVSRNNAALTRQIRLMNRLPLIPPPLLHHSTLPY